MYRSIYESAKALDSNHRYLTFKQSVIYGTPQLNNLTDSETYIYYLFTECLQEFETDKSANYSWLEMATWQYKC